MNKATLKKVGALLLITILSVSIYYAYRSIKLMNSCNKETKGIVSQIHHNEKRRTMAEVTYVVQEKKYVVQHRIGNNHGLKKGYSITIKYA